MLQPSKATAELSPNFTFGRLPAQRPTPRMRMFSMAGSGLFAGILVYFSLFADNQQTQQQQQQQRRTL